MIRSRQGYTIVEALVSAGLLGMLVAVSSQVLVSMSSSDRLIGQFSESVMVVSRVAETLKDNNACIANLSGRNPLASPSLTAITSGPTAVVTSGVTLVPQNIRVSRIQISNYLPFGVTNLGVATLDLELQLLERGSVRHSRVLPLFLDVRVNAANAIVACRLSGTGGVLEAICNALGGTLISGRCNSWNVEGTLASTGAMSVGGMSVTGPSGFTANRLINSANLSAGTVSSATMTYGGPTSLSGGLTVGGTATFNGVNSVGNICVAGVCQSFNASSCGAGQHGFGVTSAGMILCRANPPPPPPPPPPPLPP